MTHAAQANVEDFTFHSIIGKGSFGKVFLAKHKASNKVYAIKVLKKDAIIKQKEVKHIMSERNVLMNNHRNPFLIGLHYSFQTPAKLYFVLDYVNGGPDHHGMPHRSTWQASCFSICSARNACLRSAPSSMRLRSRRR